jgi:hypothetical protein
MIETKRFAGVLNTDDKPENVGASQHIDAKNIRFYGGPSGLTAENIKGNYLINNALLPAGTNECIGTFFDSVNQRIIWFNYNSNGNNGIYQLNLKTESITKIFRCGTDSATDILNFSPNYPVHSCSLVYRTPGTGDLLYWTDGYNRPRYLNVDTVSSLAPFTQDMINAAKNAPLTPPELEYQSNTAVTVNNLRKKVFRACYRWVYKNGEKSTFSPISKAPLNTIGYNPTANNNPTVDNNIEIQVVAGGNDYDAIEIAGQFNVNNTWGDFFLIDKLGRTEYNIAPGATFNYYFYNNGAYTPIAQEETLLYFSWLPDKANTLELLNGNVLIYGGVTEGYDNLPRSAVNVTVTTGLSNLNIPSISYGYAGADIINIQIGATVPPIPPFATYSIQFNYTTSSIGPVLTKSITYTNTFGQNQNSVAAGIAAALTGGGITGQNLGAGLVRAFVTGFPPGSTITNVVVSVNVPGSVNEQTCWKWSCPGRLGLVYFDDRGKTNGVISYVSESGLDTTDFAFTTPDFGVNSNIVQLPVVNASINHTPPTWATSFQWVRANLLPTSFLYWITCDYQTDANYLYLCIQNLVEQNKQNIGFVPSYEFSEGDRVRIVAQYNTAVPNFVPFTPQLDMEIVGTVQRQMNGGPTVANSATQGTFIKVFKPSSLPPQPYQQQMLIEVYTPRPTQASDTQLFFEWGEKYDIYSIAGNRFHRGQVTNQTLTQPATFEWFDGDIYYYSRLVYREANTTPTTLFPYVMDANYNDYFPSAVNSNGRTWPIDPNAKEEYNSVLVRWGGKYQDGTTLNELPIFRPNDFDMVDRSKGDIRRFKSRDRILRVFQDRGTGQYGVYMRFIQNNQGQSELVTTNEIITTNNIQYYQGVYGVSGYPTNLVSVQNADYFADVVTGRCIRLGADGLTDLGLLYKGQFYLSELVVPYNKQILLSNQNRSRVQGFFDFFNNEYHVVLQGGNRSGLYIYQQDNLGANYDLYLFGEPEVGDVVSVTITDSLSTTQTFSYTAVAGDTYNTILIALNVLINASPDFNSTYNPGFNPSMPGSYISVVSAYPLITITGSTTINYAFSYSPQNFSFNETRNAFCSFYDYHPEWATGAQDMIYTWKNGQLYKHNSPTYCNFYGVQYGASVTGVFNNNLVLKKSWHSINEVASGIWAIPNMYTNTKSYGSTNQVSNLVEAEFVILEGNPSSAIKRDANSQGGKINGDFMKGNYLVVKFEKQTASSYITLSEVSVRNSDSPLTAK